MIRKFIRLSAFIVIPGIIMLSTSCKKDSNDNANGSGGLGAVSPCDEYGAQPLTTVYPVTIPLICEDGEQLTYQQGSTIRFACINYPDQSDSSQYIYPLLVYIHGSLVTPMSLYTIGRGLFDLRNEFKLSDNDSIRGFIILSPEGRIAKPWQSNGPATGEGFHWDEWYRNPEQNLDADAIDNFIDQAIQSGKVDTNRIYVYGWSNGAYMTILYSTWRSERIAAMAQYAGGNPWTRTPCPVPMQFDRKVPLILLRNLCDAFVPCSATNQWIDTLKARNWPFEHYNLDAFGDITTDNTCSTSSGCSGDEGLAEHFRWPRKTALELMLEYLRLHSKKKD